MFIGNRPKIATLVDLLSRDLTTFVRVCRFFRIAEKKVTVIWSENPKEWPATGKQ